jgi:hypothetical protein
VRRAIARLVLREEEAQVVGTFVLRPAQREAARDILRALQRYGGALLADPPGTGKTVIALAVAQRESDVLVAAPATLRSQWLAAATRARVTVRFVSLESLSHGADPARPSLLIVDEAHHTRTPTTQRYARIARLAMGTPVLLLTATPVVNGLRDRDALLALFLGARARGLGATDLARVIVRRAHRHAARPAVRPLPALRHGADVPGIAEALRALPPPLPTADGSAAADLLRISLAMTWASSLAAFDAALRRRLHRGAALRDALAAGRWPSRATLRQWVIGDDATQLAIPLVLDDSGRAPPGGADDVLTAHLDAVRALRNAISPHVRADTTARVAALRSLLEQHPERRIAVFAQHAATIAALYRGMCATGGIVGIIGDRVLAAHGRWTRRDVLQALGPQARPFAAHDPRGIRVLLTTDLLAEGVELQGIGIVVHGDPAWTPTRLTQRVGRAARFGGGDQVYVARFALPRGATGILRLAPRLVRKAADGTEALGAARNVERLRQRLQQWNAVPAQPASEHGVPAARVATVAPVAPVAPLATVAAPSDGFVAAIRGEHGVFLVVGRRTSIGWRVGTAPRQVLRTIACAGGVEIPTQRVAVRDVRRLLARWLRRRKAMVSSGLTPTIEPRLHRRLQHRVGAAVAATPLGARELVARTASAALRTVLSAPGSGVTRALERLCRDAFVPAEFLRRLTDIAESVRAAPGQAGVSAPRHASGSASAPRLAALLILTRRRETPAGSPRGSRARPAAWPGSAAPR